ncbi:MAG TPA: hypothetical protein VLE02_02025 [Nitrosarchaeum sp.]|nr:hypothetical protein [Nitrosarchaeum sp.]
MSVFISEVLTGRDINILVLKMRCICNRSTCSKNCACKLDGGKDKICAGCKNKYCDYCKEIKCVECRECYKDIWICENCLKWTPYVCSKRCGKRYMR